METFFNKKNIKPELNKSVFHPDFMKYKIRINMLILLYCRWNF